MTIYEQLAESLAEITALDGELSFAETKAAVVEAVDAADLEEFLSWFDDE